MADRVFNKPANAPATEAEMNHFVREIDKFMELRKELLAETHNVDAMRTSDPELWRDYDLVMRQADALKRTIEATTGIWYDFKSWWATNVTDKTSMVIGDWVDEIRSWFGYDPSGGLGAFQILSAAWIAGIIAAAAIIIKSMNAVLIRIEAAKLQRETGMPRDRALQLAKDTYAPGFFGGAGMGFSFAMLAAVGIGIWLFFGKKR